MNSNTILSAQEIRAEMDLKITDTRAMLAAIEALFTNSAVELANGYGISYSDIHYLVLIALDKAREAETLSADLELAILELRRAA
jgi:hypothetical protein